jgi:hypothetical protein
MKMKELKTEIATNKLELKRGTYKLGLGFYHFIFTLG